MKNYISLAALASGVAAHYQLDTTIYNGVASTAWTNTRQYTDYYTYNGLSDVTSLDIQCNKDASSPVASATDILEVSAGSTLSIDVTPSITHPGPGIVYMAQVPEGETAATWTPSGDVWFKVAEYGPTSYDPSLTWYTDGATSISFTIPSSTPSGDYLVRAEHIALHLALDEGGAQFYISCSQITVTNGGSGSPSPTVSFPGAYSSTDAGILINIYYPVPTSYEIPGPPVWTG